MEGWLGLIGLGRRGGALALLLCCCRAFWLHSPAAQLSRTLRVRAAKLGGGGLLQLVAPGAGGFAGVPLRGPAASVIEHLSPRC